MEESEPSRRNKSEEKSSSQSYIGSQLNDEVPTEESSSLGDFLKLLMNEDVNVPDDQNSIKSFHELTKVYGPHQSKSTIIPRSGINKYIAALYLLVSINDYVTFALPYALRLSHFRGMFTMLVVGLNSYFSGLLLGWSRIMIMDRFPEYNADIASPYPMIGEIIAGRFLRYFVAVILYSALISRAVTLMRYMADLIDQAIGPTSSYCSMLIVIAVVLALFVQFTDFKCMWIVIALSASMIALFRYLLMFNLFIDKSRFGTAHYEQNKPLKLQAQSFAIFSYALSLGAATLPSIQNAMIHRKRFSQSFSYCYLGLFILYLPYLLLGFAAYGEATQPIIINNFKENPHLEGSVVFMEYLFAATIIVTFMITMKPVFGAVEDTIKFAKDNTIVRILYRMAIVGVLLLFGLLLPNYMPLLETVNALLMNILAYVFPAVFFAALIRKGVSKSTQKELSNFGWFFVIEVLLGASVAIAATIYAAITVLEFHPEKNCFFDFYNMANVSFTFFA